MLARIKYARSLMLLFCLVTLSVAAKPAAKIQVAFFNVPGQEILTTLSKRVWEEAASTLAINYTLKKADSKQQAMAWLRGGKVRVVLGPLKVHPRLEGISYVNSYIDDAVGVVLHQNKGAGFLDTISAYFKAVFGATVAFIFFVIVIFGVFLWLAERKHNQSMFSNQPVRGIASSIWQCLVTFSTVGYGDVVPKTPWGRFISAIWILISLFLVSAFVASITSELTMLKTHSSDLPSLAKLYNQKVVYVKNEQGVLDIASQYHMRLIPVDNTQAMIKMIDAKMAFAGVGNRYVLQDYLRHHHDNQVVLTPYKLVRGSYAFVLRSDDSLHRKLSNLLYDFSEIGHIRKIIASVIGVQVAVEHA